MNQKKKALLLSALCSLTVLSACDKKPTTIDGEEYYKVEDTYVKKTGDTKTFAPGEHKIFYTDGVDFSLYNDTLSNGTIRGLNYINVPEGYDVVDFTCANKSESYSYVLYLLVNTKTVEVTGEYNTSTNTYEYNRPGNVVKILEKSN